MSDDLEKFMTPEERFRKTKPWAWQVSFDKQNFANPPGYPAMKSGAELTLESAIIVATGVAQGSRRYYDFSWSISLGSIGVVSMLCLAPARENIEGVPDKVDQSAWQGSDAGRRFKHIFIWRQNSD